MADPQAQDEKSVTMERNGEVKQVDPKLYKYATEKGWKRKQEAAAAPKQPVQPSGGGQPQSWLDRPSGPGHFTGKMLEGANPFHTPEHPEQLQSHGAVADTMADALNIRETAGMLGKRGEAKDVSGAAGMQLGTFLGGEGTAHVLGMGGRMAAESPVGKAALKSLNSASARASMTARAMGSGITSQMAYAGEKLIQPVYEALNKRFAPLHEALEKKIIALTPKAEQLIRGLHELEPEVREHIGGLIKDVTEEVRKVSSKMEESGTREGKVNVRKPLSPQQRAAQDELKNLRSQLSKASPDDRMGIVRKIRATQDRVSKLTEKEGVTKVTKGETSAAKETEKVTETSKEQKYDVRSALSYDEAKNLLSHLKSVANARGLGEMSRLGQLINEVDKGIDTEAQKVGMAGLRKDSQELWGEMNALRNVAVREMKERTKVKQIVATVSKKAALLFDEESKKEIPDEFVASARQLYKKITGKEMPKTEQGQFRATAAGAMKAGAWGARYIPPISRAILSALSSGQQPQAPPGEGGGI
jgi:hypothetical protein